jgi:hypothetical protein
MSWRGGANLFIDIWPVIQRHLPEHDFRVKFTAEFLKLLVKYDLDPFYVEAVHPEVRKAMRRAGIDLSEPKEYRDDRP